MSALLMLDLTLIAGVVGACVCGWMHVLMCAIVDVFMWSLKFVEHGCWRAPVVRSEAAVIMILRRVRRKRSGRSRVGAANI